MRQLHRISGSKSSSASDGSSSVVTASESKVKVETFAGGAREKSVRPPQRRPETCAAASRGSRRVSTTVTASNSPRAAKVQE